MKKRIIKLLEDKLPDTEENIDSFKNLKETVQKKQTWWTEWLRCYC